MINLLQINKDKDSIDKQRILQSINISGNEDNKSLCTSKHFVAMFSWTKEYDI